MVTGGRAGGASAIQKFDSSVHVQTGLHIAVDPISQNGRVIFYLYVYSSVQVMAIRREIFLSPWNVTHRWQMYGEGEHPFCLCRRLLVQRARGPWGTNLCHSVISNQYQVK